MSLIRPKSKQLNWLFVSSLLGLFLATTAPFPAHSAPRKQEVSVSGADGRPDNGPEGVDARSHSPLVVPTQFQTIQSAVNAAASGDTIRILPGTYVEQVNISKDIKIVGSGERQTFIKAPITLTPGSFGRLSIVDINKGANVAMSRLTVTGPGSAPCGSGSLFAGVLVVENAKLLLSSATVTEIHNTPQVFCFPYGSAIVIGFLVTPSTGHATIHDVKVNKYEADGILLLGAGSTASISDNVITGVGMVPGMLNSGIVIADGSSASVTHNKISQNYCAISPLQCGKDLVNQFQASGIAAANAGSGTVIGANEVSGNDVGIYLYGSTGCCTVDKNLASGNKYFGIIIQNANHTVAHDVISGGEVGVGVAADLVDTVGTLIHEQITGTSLKPVQEISCCGFKATALIQKP